MINSAKPTDAGVELQLLADVELTLKHARTFIVSREKMHPHGVDLYDKDLARLSAEIERLAALSTPQPSDDPIARAERIANRMGATFVPRSSEDISDTLIERAKVVAWLREQAKGYPSAGICRPVLEARADAIERGDHLAAMGE